MEDKDTKQLVICNIGILNLMRT